MTEPDEISASGEADARERVEAVFVRIDQFGPDVQFLPVPRLDLETRETLVADLEARADAHGRGLLLDEARQRLRDGLLVVAGSRARPGYGGWPAATTGAVEDQVARLLAIEDAVSVAAVEDLLDPETAAALASPGLRMLGLPLPEFERTGPANGEREVSRLQDGTDGDDRAAAEADAAEAEVERLEQEAALRQRRAVLFVAAMAIVLPLGAAGGINLPILVVAGLGALFLAWLFA